MDKQQDVVTRIKIYQYSPHLPIIPQDEIKTSLFNIYTHRNYDDDLKFQNLKITQVIVDELRRI